MDAQVSIHFEMSFFNDNFENVILLISCINTYYAYSGSTYLLFHSCQESLGIKESGEPVCLGSASIDPLEELLVPLQQAREPVS